MKLRIFEGDWKITSGFGPRALDGFHYGHDYVRTDSTTTGSKLFASQSGILYNFEDSSSINKNTGSKAKCIFITGVGGSKDLFAHLSSFARGNGAVNAGDLIGYANSSGNVTASHLHMGRKVNNVYVDPTNHLQAGGEDMVGQDLLNAYYLDLLGRSPDPGAAGYLGKPSIEVYHSIRTSQERTNRVNALNAELQTAKAQAAKVPTLEQQINSLNTSVNSLTKGLEDIKNEMTSQEQASTNDLAQRDAVIADLQKKLDAKPPTAPQDPKDSAVLAVYHAIRDWIRKYIIN